MTRPRLPVLRSIGTGYRLTFRHFGRTLVIVGVVQGIVALVAVPLLAGAVGLATRASGLTAVTTATAGRFLSSVPGVVITVLALLLLVVALLGQAAVFATAAQVRSVTAGPDARVSLAALAHHAGARTRDLLRRPSSLVILPYLILVVPLGQVGIGSVLTRWVAIPEFATDELLKSPTTGLIYLGVLLIVLWLNLRLVFTIPILVLDHVSVPQALARSWRITRWRAIRVIGLLAGVLIPLGVTLALLWAVALVPTMITDAVAPDASVVAASMSFGVLQVAVFFTVGVFLMVQTQALVTGAQSTHALPAPSTALDGQVPATGRTPAAPARGRPFRAAAVLVFVGAVVGAGAAAAVAAGPLNEASDGQTLVLAHRGFTAGGVENTLSSLEAASAAGADLVEMDIQQTKDGGWVVMHDTDLERLAGLQTSVAAMTLAQATAVTVHDDEGHTDRIPSLREYLERADELDQQLLIEVKVHGGESPGYVADLISQIDEIDDASSHIYHTLTADVVEQFTALRPDLIIGYIVPLAYGGVPDSPAAFLVVEQGVYTRELRDAVWDEGKSLFVWTVQDAARMRELFRDDVDGIITDHPDVALRELADVSDEKGLLPRLIDAADRLVTDG